MSRSQTWFDALATQTFPSWYRSVALADCDLGGPGGTAAAAVVPDPDNAFPRARRGEVGLLEGIGLARGVREVIELDSDVADDQRRPIVAIVDVPSQAYGRLEEQFGENPDIAAAVDAYATAPVGRPPAHRPRGRQRDLRWLPGPRAAGQPGLALDDDQIEIQAIHKPAAARITLRTIAELDELAKTVTPLSFDVRVWATLGYCDGLLKVSRADRPTSADADLARGALRDAVTWARATLPTGSSPLRRSAPAGPHSRSGSG